MCLFYTKVVLSILFSVFHLEVEHFLYISRTMMVKFFAVSQM